MRRTELMSGAIVSIKGNEAKRIRVTGITKKKIQYIDKDTHQPKYLRYSELVPIRLTDQVMQDLGFKFRQLSFGDRKVRDWILILKSKKNENISFTVTVETDETLGVNKYRSVHIDDKDYVSTGYGFAKDIHELQSIIQSTTKLCLDTSYFMEKC